MERSLAMALFAAADAGFDPCGATAFAHRLGRELDAGRIVFPRPLVVGGGYPYGCLVLGRFPDDLAGLPAAARTLTRGLADIAGDGFAIGVCGGSRFGVVDRVAQAVRCELEVHRRGGGPVGRIGETTVFALL
ncbi:hypothetical protein [Amycolatopsis sp.]|uniref:hypothetical protein n=1 Tax=Amycolatopsis sp. TaxID=37632 RepID=UPI002D80EB29|nr:hypothetical protein [Amycolatopsis sp.]HET6708208.1 hypothetical protein [Amycolatopsis sp.]